MEAESTPTGSEKKEDEDDFFSSWDKPKTTPVASKQGTLSKPMPPSIGRASSAAPSQTSSTSPASSSPSTPPAVRSTPGAATRSKLGAARLGSSTTTSTQSARPAKLGAKKAVAPIDFAEAERKAKEEEERIKQLGYDRQKEEEEEAARKKAAEKQAATQLGKAAPSISSPTPVSAAMAAKPSTTTSSKHKPVNSQDLARLGMGMNRLGFGASAPSTSSSKATKYGFLFYFAYHVVIADLV